MPKIPTTILKPGEAIYEYFDLLEFYGELYVSFIKGVRHFLKPDTYFLYAELSTSGEKINSNQIKFYVVEPVQEESKAYELFKEGLFTWLGKKEDQKAANIFRKLITDYANSVYAELSFDYLQACYKIGLHDYKKAIEVGEELISKHPKSPFSGRMIKYLAYTYEHVEGKEKVKERLMQLTDKYGDVNPGIKKNALMMINRLEK